MADDSDARHPTLFAMRHGETEWSRSGQHTSRTELDLTPRGEEQAARLGTAVPGVFDLVLCSPRLRARRTAEIAGLVPYEVTDDLAEWDYGEFEGLTTPQIQELLPGWSIWEGPWPGGENADEVAGRADRLIARLRASPYGRVALVGHGHMSRVIAARWVGERVQVGRWLDLNTATVSELGWSRQDPVIRHWNVVPAP